MASKVSILRNIQNKKSCGFILSPKLGETVAIVKKNQQSRYVNCDPKSKVSFMDIANSNFIIEPYIPFLERFIIFISGASGSGKTCLSSIFINQYLNHYKNRKAYYLCNTAKKDDPNLAPIKRLQQLDTDNILDLSVEDMKNSLIVVDDTDFHDDHKAIMKWLNTMVECGRKFGVSIIYSSHIHSKVSESPIYKEVSMYITFSDSLINNRMLSTHLQIPDNTILDLAEGHHAFICFNKIFRAIITDKTVSKF